MTYNKGSHYSERLKRRVKNFSSVEIFAYKSDDFETHFWAGDFWNEEIQDFVPIERPAWYNKEQLSEIGCGYGTFHNANVNSLRAFRRYVKKLNKYLPSGLKVRLISNFFGIDDIVLYTRKEK